MGTVFGTTHRIFAREDMPFVSPQLVTERVAKYKPLLESAVNKDVLIFLEKKTNWSRHGNCRIIIQSPQPKDQHPLKDKDRVKAIIANSADEGDLLENEWGYVLQELPSLLPKDRNDPNDLFNWLVDHFKNLTTNDKPEKFDINASKSRLVTHQSANSMPFVKTPTQPETPHSAGSPAGTPSQTVLEEKQSPSLPSINLSSPALVATQQSASQSTSKNAPKVLDESTDEEEEDLPQSSLINNLNPETVIKNKIQHLTPRNLLVGIFINFAIVLLHEWVPHVVVCSLLIVVNVILLECWIWFKEGQQILQLRNSLKKKPKIPSAKTRNAADKVAFSDQVKSRELPIEKEAKSETIDDKEAEDENEAEAPKEKRRETMANLAQKLVPGETLAKIGSEKHESEVKNYGEWTWVSGDTVAVRDGPDYANNRKKSPSEDPIYDTVGVDVYSISKKVWHIGRWFDLDVLDPNNPDKQDFYDGLPRFIILNVLCPGYAPSMFAPVTDGEGFMTVIWLRISEKTRQRIASGQWSSGMKILKRFIEESPLDAEMRGRLKVIARATNIDELNFGRVVGGLVSRYNGTPFLIHDKEAEFFKGDNYFEFDVDMHTFSSLTRNAFYHLKGLLKSIRAHFAFVIEGRSDDELPEQLVSITEVFNVQNLVAPELPVDLSADE
jgi:hypothetical protein